MKEAFEFNEESLTLRKKQTLNAKRNVISLITQEDRTILIKLGILFTLSIVLGCMVLIFFAFLATGINSENNDQELILLYLVFFTEIFGCLLIYYVFTTQIKVKDKSYLKFFSSISLEMNAKIPKLKFPRMFKDISLRLHKFYS